MTEMLHGLCLIDPAPLLAAQSADGLSNIVAAKAKRLPAATQEPQPLNEKQTQRSRAANQPDRGQRIKVLGGARCCIHE
jgi:hypothetical protein